MAQLRLAILKQIDEQSSQVILEYKEDQVFSRLQAQAREILSGLEKPITKKSLFRGEVIVGIKREWTIEEITAAYAKAWSALIGEFKEETVRIQ